MGEEPTRVANQTHAPGIRPAHLLAIVLQSIVQHVSDTVPIRLLDVNHKAKTTLARRLGKPALRNERPFDQDHHMRPLRPVARLSVKLNAAEVLNVAKPTPDPLGQHRPGAVNAFAGGFRRRPVLPTHSQDHLGGDVLDLTHDTPLIAAQDSLSTPPVTPQALTAQRPHLLLDAIREERGFYRARTTTRFDVIRHHAYTWIPQQLLSRGALFLLYLN
jgi:hypothetical protein